VTASPPKKVKRRVGRPRRLPPQFLAAVLQTPARTFEMYNFVTQYRSAHPGSSEDAAIAAAEEQYHCSRSTIQRHIARLEEWGPVIKECVELLRQPLRIYPPGAFDLTPHKGLRERLAVFYSPDEVSELRKLGAPLTLKLAQEREELQALRALKKPPGKKTAR
jgi:hypothetical protein